MQPNLEQIGARFWNGASGRSSTVSALQGLLLPCQGKPDRFGHPHCGGMIRVPFSNPLGGGLRAEGQRAYWDVVSGSGLDDLTLTPSIDADMCGHFSITNGRVVPAGV